MEYNVHFTLLAISRSKKGSAGTGPRQAFVRFVQKTGRLQRLVPRCKYHYTAKFQSCKEAEDK